MKADIGKKGGKRKKRIGFDRNRRPKRPSNQIEETTSEKDSDENSGSEEDSDNEMIFN